MVIKNDVTIIAYFIAISGAVLVSTTNRETLPTFVYPPSQTEICQIGILTDSDSVGELENLGALNALQLLMKIILHQHMVQHSGILVYALFENSLKQE